MHTLALHYHRKNGADIQHIRGAICCWYRQEDIKMNYVGGRGAVKTGTTNCNLPKQIFYVLWEQISEVIDTMRTHGDISTIKTFILQEFFILRQMSNITFMQVCLLWLERQRGRKQRETFSFGGSHPVGCRGSDFSIGREWKCRGILVNFFGAVSFDAYLLF